MPDVLLIDDNRNFRLGLAANLRRAGFDVSVAAGGEEGLKLAREIRPEIIVCDLKMPELDGMAVKRALNAETAMADIPFIFLSAHVAPSTISQGLLSGADDYLAKPCDMAELIARIQTALRRESRLAIRSKLEVQQILENLKSSLPIQTSHQFRTQLGILVLSLEMASRKPDNVNKYIDYAASSAFRLKVLVNTLIWLNEFDLDRCVTHRQQLNMASSFLLPLKETLEAWKEKDLKLDFRMDIGLTVSVPAHYFIHAIYHLVDNACRFSPQGGVITVHLKSNGSRGCILTIQDQGPGIPDQMRELVFERFYQIPNVYALPENHGMGLGLFLTRSFARSLNGNVTILDSTTGCLVQMILN